MANRNYASGGKIYSMHVKPVLLDCNFIVDSTNGNGLGIRSLKGPMIADVYMHTSSTPAVGNPNPAPGVIVVQINGNFNRYFGGFSGQVSALGASSATITANTAYVITSLGTTTPAQWVAAGLPIGFTPAVGAAFIAASSQTIPGAPTVAPSASSGSGIDHIEVLGDVNQTIAPNHLISGAIPGSQLILQCFSGGVLTAPANGSAISLSFYLSESSILIQGE